MSRGQFRSPSRIMGLSRLFPLVSSASLMSFRVVPSYSEGGMYVPNIVQDLLPNLSVALMVLNPNVLTLSITQLSAACLYTSATPPC